MGGVFKLCIFLTLSVFVGVAVVIGSARLPYPDPLAAYQVILPGRSIDGVQNYPCQLHVGMSGGIEVGFCQFVVNDGVFEKITVVDANHLIARIDLVVQPGRLRLGDLMLCWGNPTEIVAAKRVDMPTLTHLRWGNHMDASLARARYERRLDYFLPVASLSLEREYVPCASAQQAEYAHAGDRPDAARNAPS